MQGQSSLMLGKVEGNINRGQLAARWMEFATVEALLEDLKYQIRVRSSRINSIYMVAKNCL